MLENTKSPEQKFEDAKLAFAVYQMLKQDNEESLRELSEDDKITISNAARDSLGQRLSMIEKELRKHKSKAIQRNSIAEIIRVVVAVIIVLNIAVGIAVAASAEFRKDVATFLLNINDSYAEMKLISPVGTSMGMDSSDISLPSYLLEGYTLYSYNKTPLTILYSWENRAGDIISIEMYNENTQYRINAEGAEVTSIDIRETTATVIQQSYGETNVIWMEGQNYIIVTATSKETAIKIAESALLTNN